MIRTLALFLLLMWSVLAVAGNCTGSYQEEFAPFFSTFAADKSFSVERTRFPLRAMKWEYGIDSKGKDESAPRRFNVSKEKFASTPSIATTIKDHGLTSRIKSVQTRIAVVELFKEGSDWFTSHHFKRVGNCWYLYEYQDHSL
jgi:hypothetical protein